MKVAVVYNRDRSGVINVLGLQNKETYDANSIEAVASALESGGHNVRLVDGNMHVIDNLREFMPRVMAGERPGMVFNMAYGIQGVSRYTHMPGMLEMLGVPYVGSNPQAHGLALDKVVAKIMFNNAGIPTPRYWNFGTADDQFDDLKFPVIVKPKMEAMSSGIRIVHNEDDLRASVAELIREFNQHVLVEQFIAGREFTVGLLGNDDVEVLPVVELDMQGDPQAIRDDEENNPREKVCPAPLSPEKNAELQDIARRAFHALGLSDYSRIDVRMDQDEEPYLLEINSMADLGQDGAYVAAAAAAGYDFQALINRILDLAAVRYFGADHLVTERRSRDARSPSQIPELLSVRLRRYLRSQARAIETRLCKLVNSTSTPEENIELIGLRLQRLGFTATQVEDGHTLYFKNHTGTENDVLVIAHREGARGSAGFQEYAEDGNRLYGSGVSTTTGCVVLVLAALRALRFARVLRDVRCGIVLATQGPAAAADAALIERLAKRSRRIVGVTQGDLDGGLVVSRSGQATYSLATTYHKAEQSVSRAQVVQTLCERVLEAQRLSGADGNRVGVTRLSVAGGLEELPIESNADLTVHFEDAEQGGHLDRRIRAIVEKESVPGLRIEVERRDECPPMPETEANRGFLSEVERIAKEINVSVHGTQRSMPSSICPVPEGVPTLEGFGPPGSASAPGGEYILRHALLERALLLSLVIHASGSKS